MAGRVGTASVILALGGAASFVAFASPSLAIVLVVGILAFLGLDMLRTFVSRRVAHGVADGGREADESEERRNRDALLAAARVFFYGGMVTLGLISFRPAFGFTLSDWLFVTAILITIASIVVTRRVGKLELPVPRGMIVGLLLFAAGGLVASLSLGVPLSSVGVVARVLYITLVWFWLGAILLTTPQQVRFAMTLWVCSAAVCGAGAIAQVLLGDVIPGGVVASGRVTGFTTQFNLLGGVTAVALVPALALLKQYRHDDHVGTRRVVLAIAIPLILSGLILSGSVGSLLAAAVGLLVFLVIVEMPRSVMAACVIFVAAAGTLAAVAPGAIGLSSPVERATTATTVTPGDPEEGTFFTRLRTYGEAVERITDNPVVGVGLDIGSSRTESGRQVHNMVLAAWHQAGLLGFVGLLLILSVVPAIWAKGLASTSADARFMAMGLGASIATAFMFAMSEPVLYQRYVWIPLAILIALNAASRTHSVGGAFGPANGAAKTPGRLHA